MAQHGTHISSIPHRQDDKSGTSAYPLPEMIKGTLISRYKRFLADVRLFEGETVTVHCPNSGSMRSCCRKGAEVYLSESRSPGRKLKFTWELIQMETSLVGVNALLPNRLVAHTIEAGGIPELSGYDRMNREVRVSTNTRIDLCLSRQNYPACYVEIKNCTFVEDGIASFPDAITVRGQKHIYELSKLASNGFRAVLFFLIQRMDARLFQPADRIDPLYGSLLRKAHQEGVEILVYDTLITERDIRILRPVPFSL